MLTTDVKMNSTSENLLLPTRRNMSSFEVDLSDAGKYFENFLYKLMIFYGAEEPSDMGYQQTLMYGRYSKAERPITLRCLKPYLTLNSVRREGWSALV